jgi:hypothetical protein
MFLYAYRLAHCGESAGRLFETAGRRQSAGKAAIYLNSQETQGDWDLPALSEWLGQDKDLDPEDYGFSQVSLEVLLGEEGKGLFGKQSAEAESALDDLEAMSGAASDEEASDDDIEEKNAAVERRQKMRAKGKKDHEDGDTERMLWVVFKTRKAREEWLDKRGINKNTRYLDPKELP